MAATVTRSKEFVTEQFGNVTVNMEKVVKAAGVWEPREKLGALIATLFFISFVTLACMHALYLDEKTEVEYLADKCSDVGCLRSTVFMQSNLDVSVNPCTDAFRTMCGSYASRYPLSPSQNKRSVQSELRAANEALIHQMLQKGAGFSAAVQPEAEKFIRFYQSCINTYENSKLYEENNPMVADIAGDGSVNAGWYVAGTLKDGYNWKVQQYNFINSHRINPMVAHLLQMDPNDFLKYTVAVDMDHTTTIWHNYYPWLLQKYKVMVRSAGELLARDFGLTLADADVKDRLSQFVEDVILMDNTIANVIKSTPDLGDGTNGAKKTIGEMNNQFSYLADWLPMLQFYNTPLNTMNEGSLIFMQHSDSAYYTNLNEAMRQLITGNSRYKTIMNNYLVWRTLHDWLPIMSYEYSHLRREYDEAMWGATEFTEDWHVCLDTTAGNMNLAIGALFVSKHGDNYDQNEVSHMVEGVRQTLREKLDGNDDLTWMSRDTKTKSRAKIDQMQTKVGQPDFWKTDEQIAFWLRTTYSTVDFRDNDFYGNMKEMVKFNKTYDAGRLQLGWTDVEYYTWFWTPQVYHFPYTNVLLVHSGQLMFPYYSKDQPHYVNFGHLGSTITLWMMDAINGYIGRYFTVDGIRQDWWDTQTATEFEKRFQCLDDHLINTTWFKQHEVTPSYYWTHEIAQQTASAKYSWTSYNTYINNRYIDEEKSIPVIYADSNEEMYYVSYIQNYCNVMDSDYEKYIISNNWVTEEVIVNEALRQIPQFSSAFQCRSNDVMNLKDRCDIW